MKLFNFKNMKVKNKISIGILEVNAKKKPPEGGFNKKQFN